MSKYGTTVTAAIKRLTFGEMIAIEDHFGRSFNELGGVRATVGLIWVLENRGAGRMSWADVAALGPDDVEQRFDPEPDESIAAVDAGPKASTVKQRGLHA